MKPIYTLIIPLFFPSFLFSQNIEFINAPVTVNGKQLLSPWAGGMNAPQWSKADLDADGIMDIYAFDRDGFIHLPFLNVGGVGEGQYAFERELAANFPITWNFVLLRDFNDDGIMDFFGHSQNIGIPGFRVYRGYIESGQLKFDLMEFSNWIFDVITIPLGTGGYANLNVNNIDYPAIDDIDGDGDLDILVLDTESGRDVNYFQNFALEQGFTKDTLIFEEADECWGKFFLPNETTSLVLSTDPNECATGFTNNDELEKGGGLHGAGTLCTFDEDNDGDKELLYGDLNFPQIIEGINGGSLQNAWMNDQDTLFPNYNFSIHMPDFPAAYYLDFDNDGLNDLMVAPNESNVSPDAEVWFYKNVTSNEFPSFNFVKKDAMVDEMIDVGKGSHPAFFDYNADGLMDFVVGNFEKTTTTDGQNAKEASLYLYENIGTSTDPAFELVDDDWLGFKQYSIQVTNYAPAFGDLDQDGDLDLLVGEEDGYMFFVENTAGAGNPATWGLIFPRWKDIRIGNYPTPFIYDINKDGLEDLIIGEQGGNINYLPNIGTVGNPDFHDDPDEAPNNKFLGAISTVNGSSGFSAPAIVDINDTTYLVTGTVAGHISVYEVDENKLEFGDSFKLVELKLGDLYLGTHSRISFAYLIDNDTLDAIVGNRRGGVSLFASPFIKEGEVAIFDKYNELNFNIFPNPADNYIFIKTEENYLNKTTYNISNTLGQYIQQGILNNNENKINIAALENGIYFIQIKQGGKIGVRKLVVK